MPPISADMTQVKVNDESCPYDITITNEEARFIHELLVNYSIDKFPRYKAELRGSGSNRSKIEKEMEMVNRLRHKFTN